MTKIGVWQFGTRDLASIANASRDAMARSREGPELEIGFAAEDGVLLGAFQRACDGPTNAVVRGTPGCAVRVGPGTLCVLCTIQHLECDETQILNRHVRALLRALGGRYFGRDWIDVAHRPVAHVGFAHERATRRTVVEAFVAVRTPFTLAQRASYLGKAPATLEEARGKKVDDAKLVRAVIDAYVDGREHEARDVDASIRRPAPHRPTRADPPWAARVDEAIGPVCAGPDASGRMRVGGEWMGSFDAVRDLEERIARGEEIAAAVDAAFTPPHTALFGVRSLDSFARALRDASLAIR